MSEWAEFPLDTESEKPEPETTEQMIPMSMVDQIIRDMRLTTDIRMFCIKVAEEHTDAAGDMLEFAKKIEDYITS